MLSTFFRLERSWFQTNFQLSPNQTPEADRSNTIHCCYPRLAVIQAGDAFNKFPGLVLMKNSSENAVASRLSTDKETTTDDKTTIKGIASLRFVPCIWLLFRFLSSQVLTSLLKAFY